MEAGTIGFIAFISIWIGLFGFVENIQENGERGQATDDSWILNGGTAAAATAFGLHAAMDLTFPRGHGHIVVDPFCLLNAGSRLEARTEGKRLLQHKPAMNISLAAIGPYYYYCRRHLAAHSSAREGDRLLQEISEEQQLQEKEAKILIARSLYEKATQLDH